MDPRPNTSPPLPSSTKRVKIVQILLGSLLLMIGFVTGYLVRGNIHKPAQNNPILHNSSITPIDTVKIEPIHAAKFEKRVITEDYNCDEPGDLPIGLILYLEKDGSTYGSSMTINNLTFTGTKKSSENLKSVSAFLNSTETLPPQTSLQEFDEAFRAGCSGSFNYVYEQIGATHYPNTDRAKSLIRLTGQDGVGLAVSIFAQKGNDLIAISDMMDTPTINKIVDKCGIIPNSDLAYQCYHQALTSDTTARKEILNHIDQLINLYAIE